MYGEKHRAVSVNELHRAVQRAIDMTARDHFRGARR